MQRSHPKSDTPAALTELCRAVPSRAEPCQAEPSRAEPCRAEPNHAEPCQARLSGPGLAGLPLKSLDFVRRHTNQMWEEGDMLSQRYKQGRGEIEVLRFQFTYGKGKNSVRLLLILAVQ